MYLYYSGIKPFLAQYVPAYSKMDKRLRDILLLQGCLLYLKPL